MIEKALHEYNLHVHANVFILLNKQMNVFGSWDRKI